MRFSRNHDIYQRLYHIIQMNGEGPHRETHNYIIYYKVAHDDNFLTAESQRLT